MKENKTKTLHVSVRVDKFERMELEEIQDYLGADNFSEVVRELIERFYADNLGEKPVKLRGRQWMKLLEIKDDLGVDNMSEVIGELVDCSSVRSENPEKLGREGGESV